MINFARSCSIVGRMAWKDEARLILFQTTLPTETPHTRPKTNMSLGKQELDGEQKEIEQRKWRSNQIRRSQSTGLH